MKVLVTGGAGFIGSNFVHYLLEKHPDYQVVVLDKLTYAGNLENLQDLEDRSGYQFVRGDICDARLVDSVVQDCQAVVNFAAETHVDRSIVEPGAFLTTDVVGTYVLLEAVRRFRISRFVQISTDEVYGNAEAPDGSSRPSLETDALKPRSPYAASKAGADRLAFSYWATYGTPVVISRCSNNYGPFQYPEKLIPLFVCNALQDKPLPVYGSGNNTRDWIHVRDHCTAIDLLLHAGGCDGEVFNIGSSTEKSILQIGSAILETLGKPCSLLQPVVDRPGHVLRHAVDSSKMQQQFGWSAATPFEEGIVETVRWYADNQHWIRNIFGRKDEFLARAISLSRPGVEQ